MNKLLLVMVLCYYWVYLVLYGKFGNYGVIQVDG